MINGCFVGIDVGFGGGIAALIDGSPMPALFDMPTVEFSVRRRRNGKMTDGTETLLDTSRLCTILESFRVHEPIVWLEIAQVRPGQGVVSSSKFYGQFTEIRGILVALKIPFETVHPASWKADIFRGQTRSVDDEGAKELSRLKAIQLFPALSERLALKKTHGQAEALLIAEYARRRRDVPF